MNTEPDDLDFINQLAEEAADPSRKVLPVDFIGRVTSIAKELIDEEAEVARIEELLTAAKEKARVTREETLPQLMREAELESFTLADGSTVSIDDELGCTITELNKPAAFAWLASKGLDGVIKTSVVVEFGKDEREAALAFVETVRSSGLEPELKEGVHPMTLKSLLKEQRAAGVNVPQEPFSLRPYMKAKVKPPSLAAAKKARARKQAGLL